MVDVTGKPDQYRKAVATARLSCQPGTLRALRRQALPKGDVLTVAQIAGIQAAKRTAELIPLCHSLCLSHVAIQFQLTSRTVEVHCTAETRAGTGVEMEALTGATLAALALYDMCKAIDRTMTIEGVRVVEKIKK